MREAEKVNSKLMEFTSVEGRGKEYPNQSEIMEFTFRIGAMYFINVFHQ
jgi:hypothetical protein